MVFLNLRIHEPESETMFHVNFLFQSECLVNVCGATLQRLPPSMAPEGDFPVEVSHEWAPDPGSDKCSTLTEQHDALCSLLDDEVVRY